MAPAATPASGEKVTALLFRQAINHLPTPLISGKELPEMSERYQFNSTDHTLLKAVELLLRKAAGAESTKPAERVSIAKLQHVLAVLPRVTSGVDVKVSVVSPRRNFGEIETFHWWDVAVEDDRIYISSGGHFFRPNTGGDTFTTMSWTAIPEDESELDDHLESLRIVPDVCSFPEGVARIDLSAPDFRLEVADEDNPLLDGETDEIDEEVDIDAFDSDEFEAHGEQDGEQAELFADLPLADLDDEPSADVQVVQRFNERALELLVAGRFNEAEVLLEEVLDKMPAGWKPVKETPDSIQIAFWDRDEFFAHTRHMTSRSLEKSIFWVSDSYSHAWHILAVVASEQGRFEHALFCLDCGIELEPDHPDHWSEKGFVLGKQKRHEEALQCYERAAIVRNWAPAGQIARALRGQGVQLIDLQRLDDAETALNRSIELEPNSEIAKGELEYIEQIRRQQSEAKEDVPWFLRALAEPPTDPLTIELLQLVEDLPPIPGPKTFGSENYSRLSDAFIERGWPGFEEEFDRIVHRGRLDYEKIKRDLLREPIFSPKAHQNLARGLAAHMGIPGESFEDIMADILKRPDDRKTN